MTNSGNVEYLKGKAGYKQNLLSGPRHQSVVKKSEEIHIGF
jgi:hypothetical protein